MGVLVQVYTYVWVSLCKQLNWGYVKCGSMVVSGIGWCSCSTKSEIAREKIRRREVVLMYGCRG